METIQINASKPQLSKLRQGKKVNISQGEGFHLHIQQGKPFHKNWNKHGRASIQLSPDELLANQTTTTIPQGKGIFGKKFDRFLEKHKMKDTAYKVGELLKPVVKKGLKAGVDMATPFVTQNSHQIVGDMFNMKSKHLINDYLDNPSKYQKHIGMGITACPLDYGGSGLYSQGGGASYAQKMENGSMGLGGSILHIHHPALHPSFMDSHFISRHFV